MIVIPLASPMTQSVMASTAGIHFEPRRQQQQQQQHESPQQTLSSPPTRLVIGPPSGAESLAGGIGVGAGIEVRGFMPGGRRAVAGGGSGLSLLTHSSPPALPLGGDASEAGRVAEGVVIDATSGAAAAARDPPAPKKLNPPPGEEGSPSCCVLRGGETGGCRESESTLVGVTGPLPGPAAAAWVRSS